MGTQVVILSVHLLMGSVGSPLARHRDVVTTQGAARGYFAPHPPHFAYLGLPYARPPTRARFKAPRPPRRWDGTFEATHRVRCTQPDGGGSEDCLVVNVFVPVLPDAKQLPVLVHIHDGGFQRGWGQHKPPVRLLRLGFIVVTFNYRLGALGFLCLQTPGVPGNAGLKDQVAALYWVHRNIARFGGNPGDVTLYGTGSGAVSVELLLLSELTIDLVHKAIIESGAVLAPSSISRDPAALAMADAINLGFTGTRQDLEKFYDTIATRLLVNSSQLHMPCIENNNLYSSLLDVDPAEILKHGIYHHVPLLISYTKAEEVMLVMDHIEKFNVPPQNFEQLLPSNLEFETEDIRHQMATLVKDFYFDKHYELSESVVQNYIDYINDIFMEYPIAKSTLLHAAKSTQPVYLMKYTNKGPRNTASGVVDAGHGNIFNYMFSYENLESSDELIAERLLSMWRNFIILGDPTPLTTALIPVIWQPVSAKEMDGTINIGKLSYMHFDQAMANVKPEGQQLIFWDYIYEKFYKQFLY